MKRLSILTALLAALALWAPASAGAAPQQVILCYTGEVCGIDLIYAVPAGTEIEKVSFPAGSLGDWNYVEAEGRLYISAASAEPMDLAAPLAQINANGAELTLEAVSVNGGRWDEPVLTHTPEQIAGTPPTCDRPGVTDGSVCARCGAVLVPQQEIPAIGPVLSAWIDAKGTLHVSGVVSDASASKWRMLPAVYDAEGRMLWLEDVSRQPPNDLHTDIPNCSRTDEVKLFRLDASWSASALPVSLVEITLQE